MITRIRSNTTPSKKYFLNKENGKLAVLCVVKNFRKSVPSVGHLRASCYYQESASPF